ncbi:MAG: GDP-mannose 4,6-dehydratase [Proteobacteria bacterium]|nr:GDP-mannose 4,6-dehydratase [Pseudomonadota bacterium]
MTVLITGAAGFIGFHTSLALIEQGLDVIGIDNFDPYYDVNLKKARFKHIQSLPAKSKVQLFDMSIMDAELPELCRNNEVKQVIHMAALPGVRGSIARPLEYLKINIDGHGYILELCRHNPQIERLIYASSSSVYGHQPQEKILQEEDVNNNPASLYAASKLSDELLTTAYANLFDLHAIGLRFFTVYGPWGRPDMATWKFIESIMAGKPIRLFNNGNMRRDFTFVEDIVSGIVGAMQQRGSGHTVYNLGGGNSINLSDFVAVIEKALGKKAMLEKVAMQSGDVMFTHADISKARRDLGFEARTDIVQGIAKTVAWHKQQQALLTNV